MDTTGRADSTTRRAVLAAAGATSASAAAAALFADGVAAKPNAPREIAAGAGLPATIAPGTFPQSVASGGPTPTGVILWTRIAPDAVEDSRQLRLDVSPTDDFANERTFAIQDGPKTAADGTVQVDLDGELEPDTVYHYRFRYGRDASRTGRCRTLPSPDASPDSLRLAVATCNNYQQGLFAAYSHIAREDVDYLVHLGDLIYEYGGSGPSGRSIELPSGNGQAWTLEDFRHLHRTYRSDRHLQRALERHTLIHTWDDHEIVNNRWWNYDADAPETASHPRGGDPAFMCSLYVQGIQALTEYLPLRPSFDSAADFDQEAFRLYRSFRFGDLAELFMTDERLYRTPPPEDALGRRDFATPPSEAQDDADRWMLGSTQRDWLIDGMDDTPATWKLWGNEVLNVALKIANAGEDAVYINYDAWDGYEHERRTIMGALSERAVDNVVTLTGDMHTYLVGYLKLDYKDTTQSEHVTDDERVGVELMTPAISSNNLVDSGLVPPAQREQAFDQGAQTQNPHIEWVNSNNYGYSVIDITPDACTYTAYAVDRTTDDPNTPKTLLRAFRVPAGRVELEEIAGDPVPEADGSDARDAVGAESPTEVDGPVGGGSI